MILKQLCHPLDLLPKKSKGTYQQIDCTLKPSNSKKKCWRSSQPNWLQMNFFNMLEGYFFQTKQMENRNPIGHSSQFNSTTCGIFQRTLLWLIFHCPTGESIASNKTFGGCAKCTVFSQQRSAKWPITTIPLQLANGGICLRRTLSFEDHNCTGSWGQHIRSHNSLLNPSKTSKCILSWCIFGAITGAK